MICLDSHLSKIQKIKQATEKYTRKGKYFGETKRMGLLTQKRIGQFYIPNNRSMCTKPDIEFSVRTKLLLMRGPVYFNKTVFTIERIQNEHGFQQCFGSTGGVLVKGGGSTR